MTHLKHNLPFGKGPVPTWYKVFAALFACGGIGMLALSLLFVTRPLQASGPSSNQVLNYQARLTDNNGIPLPDGTKNVKFVVYDALTVGNCEYSVRGTCGTPTAKSVTVANGHFSTLFGEAGDVAMPAGLFSGDESRFLEIQVETSTPGTYETLSPRKRIVSGPFAMNANLLDDLDTSAVGGSAAFVPVTDSSGNLVLTKDLSTVTFTVPGSAAPAVSSAGQGRIYFDSTSNTFKTSANGSVYTNLGDSGWTDSGTSVTLTTASDSIGMGVSPVSGYKLTVDGDVKMSTGTKINWRSADSILNGIQDATENFITVQGVNGMNVQTYNGPLTLTGSTGGGSAGVVSFGIGGLGEVARVSTGGMFGIGVTNKLSRLTVKPAADGAISGTTTASSSTTITGSGTTFLTSLGIGDRISLSSAAATYATVTAIASDTSLTVDTALGNGTSQTINKKSSIFRLDDASNAAKFVVNDQGHVGIGTVSVAAATEVLTLKDTGNTFITLDSSGAGTATGLIMRNNNGVNTATLYGESTGLFLASYTNELKLYSGGMVQMNVTSTGTRIGGPASGTAAAQLEVFNSGAANDKLAKFTASTAVSTPSSAGEFTDFDVDMVHTVTFTGAATTLATQRAARFVAPTYASDTATKTITDAATLAVTGAPIAGTNVTITNPLALWIENGNRVQFGPLPGPGSEQLTVSQSSGVATLALRASVNNTTAINFYGDTVNYGGLTFLPTTGTYSVTDASGSALFSVGGGTAAKINRLGLLVSGNSGGTFPTQNHRILSWIGGGAGSLGFRIDTSGTANYPSNAEAIDVDLDLSGRTYIFGADVTNQRSTYLQAPTITGSTTTRTITNAATLAISGAPVAGTLATITNPYALLVEAGNSRFAGTVDIPGSGTDSLRLGKGSTATTLQSTAIGVFSNATTGTGAAAFANSANATATGALAVGSSSQSTSDGAVALGYSANASGLGAVALGNGAANAGTFGIAIGQSSTVASGHLGSIGIGFDADTTAANQLVIGSSSATYGISDVYIGRNVTNAAPGSGFTLNATGGSGTNIAGAGLTLAGGRGTGSAVGGDILFKYAAAGSSGTSLNALATACVISGTNGSLSCPGTSTNSERFGAAAVATGTNNLAVGYGANAATNESTALGYTATATGLQTVAIGWTASASSAQGIAIGGGATSGGGISIGSTASASGGSSIAIGLGAVGSLEGIAIGRASAASGLQSVAIGYQATASTLSTAVGWVSSAAGDRATALGNGASAGHTGAIAIGTDAVTTATAQAVIGSSTYPISTVFFGKGVTNATPTAFTINGTGGSGTDIAGAALQLAGGKGTGNAAGGSIIFQTSDAGASGTTLQTLTTKMTILPSGNVAIGATTTSFKLEINDINRSTVSANMFIATTDAQGADIGSQMSLGGFYDVGARAPFAFFSGRKENGTGGNESGYLALGTNTNGSGTTEKVRITSTGDVGIGTTIPSARLSVVGDNNSAAAMHIVRYSADTGSSSILLRKSRGTTGTPVIVNSGDGIGTLNFTGYDGTTFRSAASITAEVDGTPGTSDMPGRLIFLTAADGSFGGTERMRIDNAGNVGINDTTPDFTLDVEKASATVAAFDRLTDDGMIIELRQGGVTEGDISVSGTTVSYNAFTGSHYAWTDEDIQKGLLVSLTGDNRQLHDNPDSEILYGVAMSATKNDSKVMGAYLALREPSKARSNENPHLIMAVGNGEMWATEEGGNIEAGDYLISGSTSGHAMKDDGASPTSYIVARAAESIDWSNVTETTPDNKKHKLISVFFESFTRKNESSQLTKTEDLQTLTSDLNVNGKLLLNVRGIIGLNWSISEAGALMAKEAVLQKVTIKNTDAMQTIGSAALLAGTDSVRVENASVTPGSKIFTSFNKNPKSAPWIDEKGEGYFILKADSPVVENVQFDYWLIDVVDETTPAPVISVAPPAEEPVVEETVIDDLVVEEPTP